jgi:small subunit ribosomal protein S4
VARYLDAKCKLCRREGTKLFLKGERCLSPKCPIEKKGALPPGQHGQRGRRKISDFGAQLREKQKVKRFYGVLERQLRRYFRLAAKKQGRVGERLLRLLETRLDNIVYRLGFISSRSLGRQLISHGHILVDGKRVNIPSYVVEPGQVISVASRALGFSQVKKSLADKSLIIPGWLERKAAAGRVLRVPNREEIGLDVDENLIVEYYSR